MPPPVPFKYRAFLSYSHGDTRWAKRLHGRLEAFRIDRELVGRATATGIIPKTLRPIFRDRDDFTAGHTLTEQTLAALDASAALIVLCSPASTKSRYVNEEVRLFKARHPERPVIPVILAMGSNPAGLTPPFPPALAFEVAADGTITDRPAADLLAADVREVGDGRELALAKVVAALIGVPVDDVRKRQAIADNRRIRIAAAVVAVFGVLGLVAAVLFWQHERQLIREAERHKERIAREAAHEKQLSDMQALIKSLIGASPAQAAPGAEKQVGDAVEAAVKGANAGDDRLQKALGLLKAGKPQEAEPLFRAVADEKERTARSSYKEAAAAYRNLGAIAGLADPKRAREAYAKAVNLWPTDDALLWSGWLEKEAGDLVASEQALRRLLSLKAREPTDWHAYWAQLGLGDIAMHRGSLDLALEIYRGASTPSTASPRRIPQAQDGSAICPSREKRSATRS
jgi:tetratricopeptide (TPR) repeat protein